MNFGWNDVSQSFNAILALPVRCRTRAPFMNKRNSSPGRAFKHSLIAFWNHHAHPGPLVILRQHVWEAMPTKVHRITDFVDSLSFAGSISGVTPFAYANG
jgi:hypothetical protein